jgi:hypothetical protein
MTIETAPECATVPVKITGIRIPASSKWDKDKLLALFDCEVLGFAFVGCLLIRAERGFLIAQAPRGDSGIPSIRAVRILDPAVRSAMAEAAYRAFLAIGGIEAAS